MNRLRNHLNLLAIGCPWISGLLMLLGCATAVARGEEPVTFTVKVEEVLSHDDGKSLWYHPRAVLYPNNFTRVPTPVFFVTLQKHLMVSDHYSGLYTMGQDRRGNWGEPVAVESLEWTKTEQGTVAVCDVTPGYHEPTGKVLAIGAKVLYDDKGAQLNEKAGSTQVAYAVMTPTIHGPQWTSWKMLELPKEEKYHLAMAGCAQWITEEDETILLPIYHKGPTGEAYSATVLKCAFDGETMTIVKEGQTLELAEVRGLCEPSIAKLGSTYYLTLRNDLKGYVTTSDDGLHWQPIKPWTFDDGSELGSANTQQHWLAHSDGLFLVYTRSGANNDHIIRNRAPLFLARVDTEKLHVVRASEQVVIPERGGEMGNFGANPISPGESWVTVGEGVWSDDARRRGAKGTVFIARIRWSKPSELRGGSGPGTFVDRLRGLP